MATCKLTKKTLSHILLHAFFLQDTLRLLFHDYNIFECAKFRGSCAIVGLLGLVPSCNRAFVGILWVQFFFSWVFRGFKIFSCGYFVGLKVFLVSISWVWNFFSRVFRGSKIFLVGPKFFLVSIFVGPKFSRGYFVGPKFFSSEYFVGPIFFLVVDFVIQRFSVAGCISKSDKNRNTKIHLKPRFLF